MRKSAVIMPLAFLLTGIIGFFIRRWELDTVIDNATGLAEKNAPVTVLLIGISVAVILAAMLTAILTSVRTKADREYARAFKPGSFLYVGLSFFLGLGWIVAIVLQYFSLRSTGIITIIDWIFMLLAVLSAISVVILAMGAYTRRTGAGMLVFSIIPSLFFCFWLIILYKDNAKNPVLIDFCYQSLAIAASALSFYFSAGYAYKKASPGWTVFSFLTSIFFCIVVLADSIGLPIKLMFGIIAIVSWINANAFIGNLKSKD